jgi:hypothetical protein
VKKADGTEEERKAERDLWSEAGSAVAALDKAAAEKLADGDVDKDTLLVLYAPWCPFCQVRRVFRVDRQIRQWQAADQIGKQWCAGGTRVC